MFEICSRFNMDPQWSETGDCYMLKLFRDYMFHQVDEAGQPWIDIAHVLQCLNKVGWHRSCIVMFKQGRLA